ncbi:hypothetical protein JXM83_04380 [Candidatus Woesearchaeota archaeon]|nr:hypothetical protein [Candidatus Woesearchaeota archaeon]
MKRFLNILKILIVLAILVSWTLFLYNFGIENLMSFINIKNPYLFVFLYALTGGVSFLTTGTYYVTLVALGVSGFNPFLLGISGAIGIFLGDLIFLWLGRKASDLEKIKKNNLYQKITKKIQTSKMWKIRLFCFLYTGFTPFPNDILMASLGLAKIKPIKFLPFVFFGHITLMTTISLLSNILINII